MKKTISLVVLGIAAMTLAASGAAADPGHDHGKGHHHGHKGHAKKNRFTYTVTTTDNGSCGNPWATDTVKRTFTVKKNKNGTYRLLRRDRGTFVTTGPASPGACETSGKHGTVVHAGAKGKLHGYLVGTVSGGTFNPNATCAADCGFTDVFIATFFGPAAQYSCFTDSKDCRFDFEYTAPRQGLRYHHWSDKGKGAGTMLDERFRGDIADH
jgi:hypothetical protein